MWLLSYLINVNQSIIEKKRKKESKEKGKKKKKEIHESKQKMTTLRSSELYDGAMGHDGALTCFDRRVGLFCCLLLLLILVAKVAEN